MLLFVAFNGLMEKQPAYYHIYLPDSYNYLLPVNEFWKKFWKIYDKVMVIRRIQGNYKHIELMSLVNE